MPHTGVLVGYARTSTTEQRAGLEAQLRDLKAAGCRKVFQEQVSSIGERAQLEAALDYCREDDTLGQRFHGSNHIRRPRPACRTTCGRRDAD